MLYADFQGEQGCILQLLAVQPESQLAILGDLLAGPMRGDLKVTKVRPFCAKNNFGIRRGAPFYRTPLIRIIKPPYIRQLLRSLTAVPSFSRFINNYVRQHIELLASSLAFLLEGEDGRQLLDLQTKALWLERQLQAVRQQVRISSHKMCWALCVDPDRR